jgi:hypothetical protein
VQTPPLIGGKNETSAGHLIGGMKTGGFQGVLNNDTSLYSGGNTKLSEKTDIMS